MSRRPSLAVVAFPVLVLVACLTLISAIRRSDHDDSATSPVAAARDFVIDGAVDQNGFEACGYLTPGQQHAAAARSGDGQCRQAFDDARLILERRHIVTGYQVQRLRASTQIHGGRVRVRLSHGRQGITLELVKANFAEQNEFQPPHSDWRIAGGGLALLPGADA